MSKWTTVLVGVDGSPGSRIALAWAAAEAAEHRADLIVVDVWERALPPPVGMGSAPNEAVEGSELAEANLLSIIKEELGDDPSVLVQPRLRHGNPAEVLIEESAQADLLVVGTRGRGGFTGLVLGSVSQHVAAYAKCPVAVIR